MQGTQLLPILMEKEYNWAAMGDLVAKWILEKSRDNTSPHFFCRLFKISHIGLLK